MAAPAFVFEKPERLQPFGPTVWHEFTPLANKYKAVNLGQGFPNFSGPEFALEAGSNAITSGNALLNQYTASGGHPRLVKVLEDLYGPIFNQNLTPQNICTCVGASEALYATIQAVVNPGEEVILFEPFFDIYLGGIIMAGGVPKYVPLRHQGKPGDKPRAADWGIDYDELEAAISDKTKLLIINNPHNPTGKVFSKEELEKIAKVVAKHPRLIVVCDEVYEWLLFDGVTLERFANIPGMWERTVTISSSGKTFSVTGWKVGWCIGPQPLISSIMTAHQFIPFSVVTPLQEGIAIALEHAQKINYFQDFQKMYQRKRDILLNGLEEAGLEPHIPQGSFFIIANTSSIKLPEDEALYKGVSLTRQCLDVRDWNVCRYLTASIGVAAIPPSSFYCEGHSHLAENYARFAFCKTEEELIEACKRLKSLKALSK